MKSFKTRLIIYLLLITALVVGAFYIKNKNNPESLPDNTQLKLSIVEFEKIAEKSPKEAMKKLRKDSTDYPYILNNCHVIAHKIGLRAYLNTMDFKSSLQEQDSFCNSGFLHGAIEAYFSSQPITSEMIQKACHVSVPFMFGDWQCSYGIGHGIMYTNEENVEESITICQSLQTSDMKEACINGVYMEYFNEEGIEKVNRGTPFELCQARSDFTQADCYLYAPTGILIQNGYDFESASKACTSVEDQYRGYCYQGIGMAALKKNLSAPQIVDSICSKTDDYTNCISGASSYAFFHFGEGDPVSFVCLLFGNEGSAICAEQRRQLEAKFGETDVK